MTSTFRLLLASSVLSLSACGGLGEAEIVSPDEAAMFDDDGAPPSSEGQVSQELLAPVLGPNPSGTSLRHPIVFVHGFTASRTIGGFSSDIQEALRKDGHFVFHAEVPPYLPPSRRAPLLAPQVDEARKQFCAARKPSVALATCLSTTKVNLITHSMGGLDARVLISGLGYGDRVASLTTISTPHKGSGMADAALKVLGGQRSGPLDAVAASLGALYSDAPSQADLKATLEALSEAAAPAFAEKYKDDPRVRYFSWAGASYFAGITRTKELAACGKIYGDTSRRDIMTTPLIAFAPFVGHGTQFLPNDGLVTVESAKHGEFQGCVPADHMDEVWQADAFRPSWWTGFDNARFMRTVAFGLSAKGF